MEELQGGHSFYGDSSRSYSMEELQGAYSFYGDSSQNYSMEELQGAHSFYGDSSRSYSMEELQGGYSFYGDLLQNNLNKENEIVGLDRDMEQIKDHLTRAFPLRLKAISIVGMGGIGKTTLARIIYSDPSVVNYFHVRLWATLSHECETRKVLISLLRQLPKYSKHDGEPHEVLYKMLIGKRFLIFMDDVWSTKALYDITKCLPKKEHGSRILVTSRLRNVATYLDSQAPHCMNFLNLENGWNLLRQKLFGKEKTPSKLEEIGRKIIKECQGLPLAINVVAGILQKVNRTPECWTKVAESVASHLTEDPKQCLDIIGLSYSNLPPHLKACFLYLGAFPANFEIPSKRLTRLWMADGFLDSLEIKNLEKVAEECLEDLMERHLILVRKGSLGRIRTCHMHDLLRDFCLREVKLGNFLHHYTDASHGGTQYPTRVILNSCSSSFNLSAPHIRVLLCEQDLFEDFFVKYRGFRVLTILDLYVSRFHKFPSAIVHFVNLRYLSLSIHEGLPSLISNLGNLQFLILNHGLGGTILPREIWNLSKLRHLQCKDIFFLPDPSGAENDGEGLRGLPNLQTLSKLSISSCTLSVIAAVSNLKKLRICETEEAYTIEKSWSSYCWNSDNYGCICTVNNLWSNLDNVAILHQLETLELIFLNTFNREPPGIPNLDAFPLNIKKLTLSFSFLAWEYMNILCMLPNLEVLKLKNYAFIGQVWEQHEGRFNQLKLLLLERTDLVHWRSTSDQFPCLERLVLKFCHFLQSIPIDIGEITTLQKIEVNHCSHFAAMSAREIQLEQQSMGNDDLDVLCCLNDDSVGYQPGEGISSVYPLSVPSDLIPDQPQPVPHCNSFHGNIKNLILLGLLLIVIRVISWERFSSNIKKPILLGLVLILMWKISLEFMVFLNF